MQASGPPNPQVPRPQVAPGGPMPHGPGGQMLPPSSGQQPNGGPAVQSASQKLSALNEQSWQRLGTIAELMGDVEKALTYYESALRHNPYSIPALTQIASLYRQREEFEKAVDFFQRIINIDNSNGEIWGAIGNCYLMMDELPKAYQAYQQAIYHLPDPKEPKLWYGIGILYDRYGSYEHAEEAFSAVMRMDPNFEKSNEIHFRLGIIYKCQQKYKPSLVCFKNILKNPPSPLAEGDIWFQIGSVHEYDKNYVAAKEAYERVLEVNPEHSKVLQQLGALYFMPDTPFQNVDHAAQLLSRAIEADNNESQAWYLLGRCYMLQKDYSKAYEAYQQAVRAIRIDPYSTEVWFDLGTLYEACNGQVNDAIDAYQRASELDPSNTEVKARLSALHHAQRTGQPLPTTSLPSPIDPPTSSLLPNNSNQPAQGDSAHGPAPGSLGQPPMDGPLPTNGVSSPGDPHHRHDIPPSSRPPQHMTPVGRDSHRPPYSGPPPRREEGYPAYPEASGPLPPGSQQPQQGYPPHQRTNKHDPQPNGADIHRPRPGASPHVASREPGYPPSSRPQQPPYSGAPSDHYQHSQPPYSSSQHIPVEQPVHRPGPGIPPYSGPERPPSVPIKHENSPMIRHSEPMRNANATYYEQAATSGAQRDTPYQNKPHYPHEGGEYSQNSRPGPESSAPPSSHPQLRGQQNSYPPHPSDGPAHPKDRDTRSGGNHHLPPISNETSQHTSGSIPSYSTVVGPIKSPNSEQVRVPSAKPPGFEHQGSPQRPTSVSTPHTYPGADTNRERIPTSEYSSSLPPSATYSQPRVEQRSPLARPTSADYSRVRTPADVKVTRPESTEPSMLNHPREPQAESNQPFASGPGPHSGISMPMAAPINLPLSQQNQEAHSGSQFRINKTHSPLSTSGSGVNGLLSSAPIDRPASAFSTTNTAAPTPSSAPTPEQSSSQSGSSKKEAPRSHDSSAVDALMSIGGKPEGGSKPEDETPKPISRTTTSDDRASTPAKASPLGSEPATGNGQDKSSDNKPSEENSLAIPPQTPLGSTTTSIPSKRRPSTPEIGTNGSSSADGSNSANSNSYHNNFKRGRTGSPEIFSRQKANKKEEHNDEPEEGEVMEEGEVNEKVEDVELSPKSSTKERSNSDVVMESGKVKRSSNEDSESSKSPIKNKV
ncbi:glucose repression mediator protein [Mycoemilia scoparia]|uniref:Glucose repression mediator protein n=1 Tax=Mycoemilia scoparia TaxID=417184 RepID=A0A9W8DXR6_9FUNG|nr:glucose repression mediator protein [Mycoemilia scoparia]